MSLLPKRGSKRKQRRSKGAAAEEENEEEEEVEVLRRRVAEAETQLARARELLERNNIPF